MKPSKEIEDAISKVDPEYAAAKAALDLVKARQERGAAKARAEREALESLEAEQKPVACLTDGHKLTDAEVAEIVEANISGKSVFELAELYKVSRSVIREILQANLRKFYQSKWQRTAQYDILRNEKLIQFGFSRLDDPFNGPKWAKVIQESLKYRADVLGFKNIVPTDIQIRFGGKTKEEIQAEILGGILGPASDDPELKRAVDESTKVEKYERDATIVDVDPEDE